MAYAEVTVIVAGALEEEKTFRDYLLLSEYLAMVEHDAEGHGYLTEVYVLWHEHDETDECECAQYVTDHHPTYTYNPEGGVS